MLLMVLTYCYISKLFDHTFENLIKSVKLRMSILVHTFNGAYIEGFPMQLLINVHVHRLTHY